MRTVIAVFFVLVGVLAIAEPIVAGLAVAVLVGWALVFAGVAHLIGAFNAGGFGRAVWQILLAVVYGFCGLYFLTHPLVGLGTLTLFLAMVLFLEAAFELILWNITRTLPGAAWRLFNALVTALLAVLIWVHWPSTSVWAIGTLVGVNLVMRGVSRLMLDAALRGTTRT